MANPLSGVGALQQLAPVTATNPTQQAKQVSKTQAVAPQDTVNISLAARVASQSRTGGSQTPTGDTDQDGDSR
jgi:hypothetical protein